MGNVHYYSIVLRVFHVESGKYSTVHRSSEGFTCISVKRTGVMHGSSGLAADWNIDND